MDRAHPRYDPRLDLWLDADAGVIRGWSNGALVHEVTDFVKDPAHADRGLTVARMGFDAGGTDPPRMRFDFGDATFDTTQARVEISRSPTWDGRGRAAESQRVVAWTDASITIELFQGALEDICGSYLYVVDDDGNVPPDGYPLSAR